MNHASAPLGRRAFLSAGAAIAAGIRRPWPEPGVSSAREIPARVRRAAAETPYWLEATGTPGLAVALIESGRTAAVLPFGFTAPDRRVPVTEGTIFQAASLSKQAVLYAALATVDAGKLDLDRPLTRYMEKPLDAPEADLEHVTARHVLTHTTGWPNWPDGDKPIRQIKPLGQWGYSGAGFFYLTQALESIWREPAADLLRRLVLDPARMKESSFVWREAYDRTAVLGFDSDGTAAKPWHPDRPNGASSLLTTAGEYARLLERFLAPDLRRRHPAAFHRQVTIDSRLGWSLGWGTAGGTLWQWGHNDGFKAFAALDPGRGLGIVTLSNGSAGQRVNREWINAWLGGDLAAFYFRWVDL